MRYRHRTLYTYLIFVLFFARAKFLENKIYTEIYTVNYQFTIFRVKSVKIYTGQKNLHGHRPWRLWQIWGMIVHLVIVGVQAQPLLQEEGVILYMWHEVHDLPSVVHLVKADMKDQLALQEKGAGRNWARTGYWLVVHDCRMEQVGLLPFPAKLPASQCPRSESQASRARLFDSRNRPLRS